ncbi:HAD family hydrolase [bacterium]|nr:HAD family hydrolase [bacterium]
MKFKAVIFDLDGTLLDTLDDLADSMNAVLRDKGLPEHPVDAYRYFVGNGAAKLVFRALPEEQRNDAFIRECLALFRDAYGRGWKMKTRLYEGVPELLDALTRQRIPMCVLTNKPQDFAELCIREFMPQWHFAVILGQREGVPLKPDPAGPAEIGGRLSIPAENILYLGDSNVDMQTAVNAGMFPVGALWGFRSETELRNNGASEVISTPEDLMQWFD